MRAVTERRHFEGTLFAILVRQDRLMSPKGRGNIEARNTHSQARRIGANLVGRLRTRLKYAETCRGGTWMRLVCIAAGLKMRPISAERRGLVVLGKVRYNVGTSENLLVVCSINTCQPQTVAASTLGTPGYCGPSTGDVNMRSSLKAEICHQNSSAVDACGWCATLLCCRSGGVERPHDAPRYSSRRHQLSPYSSLRIGTSARAPASRLALVA